MKTVLQIKGMSCAHCVQHTKKALEAVKGVKSAVVSLNDKTATVEHGDEADLAALGAAVAEAGFEVVKT